VAVGTGVGSGVGSAVGTGVAVGAGVAVGTGVGFGVGSAVGSCVGIAVGAGVAVGMTAGVSGRLPQPEKIRLSKRPIVIRNKTMRFIECLPWGKVDAFIIAKAAKYAMRRQELAICQKTMVIFYKLFPKFILAVVRMTI
jgi:hypothetical protein